MINYETMKECFNRLLCLANKVWLLATAFDDLRNVEKLLVTIHDRYEATTTTLENTK